MVSIHTIVVSGYSKTIGDDGNTPKDPHDTILLQPMTINRFKNRLTAREQRLHMKTMMEVYLMLKECVQSGPMDAYVSPTTSASAVREVRSLSQGGSSSSGAGPSSDSRHGAPRSAEKNKRGRPKPPPASPWSSSRSPRSRSDPTNPTAGTSWNRSLLAASPYM